VAVGRIDFSRDTAEVVAYYDEPKPVATATAQDTGAKARMAQPRRVAQD
jgi:hypothetical protein